MKANQIGNTIGLGARATGGFAKNTVTSVFSTAGSFLSGMYHGMCGEKVEEEVRPAPRSRKPAAKRK